MEINWKKLSDRISGNVRTDEVTKRMYATDASIYRELPLAVLFPKNENDLVHIVRFARKQQFSIIPRAAGTSLGGQVVGNGAVVDTGRYMNSILELNIEEKWVRCQPGVIRDDLNAYLKPYGLFFGPNTSTSNRCMIGGMMGNNSCGSTSIVYGTTRDHTLRSRAILSDGSVAEFRDRDLKDVVQIVEKGDLEGSIYGETVMHLSDPEIQQEIRDNYPRPDIHRRNTGYALDVLLDMQPFNPDGYPLNLNKLLCGSEGTLCITSEITLGLVDSPPPQSVLLCAHFESVNASLKATLAIMQHKPYACELMDKNILDCTKGHPGFVEHRFFIEGDPAALLMVEFKSNDIDEARIETQKVIEELKSNKMGYAWPMLEGERVKKVWDLRKAGLGLLSRIPGDAKAIACIEDTAVALENLPDYIDEFTALMEQEGQKAIYYAHAGAGELHLRPLIDLRTSHGIELLHGITNASANLVKKYRGSISGEHGDGRVRSPLLADFYGESIIKLFQTIKQIWDPLNLFNPGKIVSPKPMEEDLRYHPAQSIPDIETHFDYSHQGGMIRSLELCNGSGDCRVSAVSGKQMCPSYMVTKDEKDSTRGRSNTLREFLANGLPTDSASLDQVKEVLDLCVSCKACKTECPSGVDMAAHKAEFMQHYHSQKRPAFSVRFFSNFDRWMNVASIAPGISNLLAPMGKKILNIHPKRCFPKISQKTLTAKWVNKNSIKSEKKVFLFIDEFTRSLDAEIGRKAVSLLNHLGYEVQAIKNSASGRAALSKGFLKKSKDKAEKNISCYKDVISVETPLLGIEPSAILCFREEYPSLLRGEMQKSAKEISKHCFSICEFLYREIQNERLSIPFHSNSNSNIFLHGHCHQKALGGNEETAFLLSLIPKSQVTKIPSTCCGMAGAFGYEKDHYETSMKMGELNLFPFIRNLTIEDIIVASGHSCRHQIKDGTRRKALHPVELLLQLITIKF
jgi:FAD/FMN-containing dehydrogenase/Fe-S oxidoreductase